DGTDCNDTEGSIYPGASEYCNSVDDDCDGDIDEASALDVLTWNIDYDGDGYGSSNYTLAQCSQPPGYVSDSTDCDDLNGAVFPGAAEVCNDVDDDCNGSIDDGATIDRQTFYEDQDGDGYGVASATTESCDVPTGYAELSGDCDDDNVDISPAAQESCNSTDDDCDGVIDESDAIDATLFYADDDTDGYGDAASSILSCVNPNGYVEDATDCDDADADVSPVAQELCNGIDDNCSGVIDDPTLLPSSTYYEDADEDGYGGSSTMLACSLPSGYSAIGNDCDDNDTALNPLTGCAQDCAEILQYGFATDGNYVIDPDGIGNGLDPFAVYCDMTTDGGGWIQRAISSAGNDRVYSTNPDDSNRGTIRSGDQARYYNHLSSDGFDGGDFLHYAYSTAPNMTEFDISYLNAATGADFSDAELDALRVVVTELSEDTLMVAGGVDDSCYYGSTFHSFDGQGHEIYISDGDGANFILLTYGTQTNDEQDAFYFYHTSTQLTTAENVIMGCGSDTEITHLEPQYLLPAKIQLGWASTDNAQWGGAAYWGSEWDYFLVR
ncbi:MAG: MopE-related protein, partial [Myxococcota bacterium]|nr:MopE-related protein [Myxococcota bacterium]